MPFDPFLLVEKPPPAAELHLARDRAILKIAHGSGENVIIRRVDVIDDGLGQGVFPLQQVQIGAESGGLFPIADTVVARVRASFPSPP